LRTAYRRAAAFGTGLLLVGVWVALALGEYSWERWWTDGLAALSGATGLALVVAAWAGRRPDWVAPPEER
jgi:peptidoglycan/LPS O-acetylase OafA/YrhL